MTDYEENLSKNLDHLLHQKRLSQNELSEKTGVAQQTISKALKTGRIRQDKLKILADFFEVPFELFFTSELLINLGGQSKMFVEKKEGQTVNFTLSNPNDVVQLTIERKKDGTFNVSIST